MTGRQQHLDKDGAKADRALVLREKYDLSHDVIAQRLGVCRNNVRGMLDRARQRRDQKEKAT